MKKLSVLFTALILAISGVTVFAATQASAASQTISVSYETYGSGLGRADGKRNGVWHYFRNGHTVTLSVSSHSGAGTPQASLYKSVGFWTDTLYGTVDATKGTRSFSSKADETSGSYYLIFWGGNAQTTQKISGSIHD
ncbi:hypothetical protein [Schleiferilactobacillus harbinensis]|uniref:hypothetical protein n=1 Tax=Schleiferilactobacillus harbinensis TaxID=304207 RepID=UPI0012E7E04F|nr:hypothetical protein [Schleiferilactobacillus harbinensis]